MRLDISQKPQLLVIYPSLLIVVASFVRHIYTEQNVLINSSYGIASQQIYQLLESGFFIIDKLSIVIYIIGGVVLTKLAMHKELFTRKSLYPLICYLIFSTSFFNTQNNIFEALSSLMVILSLDRLIKSFNTKKSNFHYLFTAGVMMGSIPLLIPQGVFILPILIISHLIFKRTANELIISLSGYALPTLLYSYILWAVGRPFNTVVNNIYNACSEWNYSHVIDLIVQDNQIQYSTIFFFITIIISTIALIIYNIRNKDIQQTPSVYVLMIFSYIGILTIPTLLISTNPTALVSIMAIPLSLLMSSIFIEYKSHLSTLLYIIMILFSISVSVFHLYKQLWF